MFISARHFNQINMFIRRFSQTLFLFATAFSFCTQLAIAHPGGVDKYGGHTSSKTGKYHCHTEKCKRAQLQVENATQEARREKRQFSSVYNRDDWDHWLDKDRDCINTRHEVLASSSLKPAKMSPDGCYVSNGVWYDPYSGNKYTRPSDLDIDHIIPLAWAHRHGGASWSKSKKALFANDYENLLAVDDGLNQSKSAKGPDRWMPPNKDYHCEYLSHWKYLIVKYSLSYSDKGARKFNKLYSSCKS